MGQEIEKLERRKHLERKLADEKSSQYSQDTQTNVFKDRCICDMNIPMYII